MNSKRHQLELSGCSPTPLAHYLKALGVLRILSEQADADVAGWWCNDSFWIESSLDQERLTDFFLNRYVPTAMVVPWSGGDFFEANQFPVSSEFEAKWPVSASNERPTGAKVIEAFIATDCERLARYREAVRLTFEAMRVAGISTKNELNTISQNKSKLLVAIRNLLPDELLDWLDVTGQVNDLTTSDLTLNCLIGGGGGSDGNAHFSDNFMQCLWIVLHEFDVQKKVPPKATNGVAFCPNNAIRSALFGESRPSTQIKNLSPALFNPSAVGGANSGNGFQHDSASNPWDYVLMLEGTLLFAGGVSRRFDSSATAESAFPFVFGVSPVGPAGLSDGERTAMAREVWLPLWGRPLRHSEAKFVFSEAKIRTRSRQSKNGIDVARAISDLGVDRGINAFQRIAILRGRIGGDNYFTTCPLGRFRVKANPGVEELLSPIDSWLDRFRRAATGKNAPTRAGRALRQLESSILGLCQRGNANDVQATLITLGEAEASVAISKELRNGSMGSGIGPLPLLKIDWLIKANDGSCEFRLAAALASLTHSKVGPIRRHLEPIRLDSQNLRSKYPKWADDATDPAIVWGSGSLIKNLCNVLLRRLTDAQHGDNEDKYRLSPIRGRLLASLPDITKFIDGQVDEERIESLFKSMCLVDFPAKREELAAMSEQLAAMWRPDDLHKLPNAGYSLLKLCFLPFVVRDKPVVIEPRIARRAVSGDGEEATRLAVRRLRADGFIPAIQVVSMTPQQSMRAAAALMFPIGVRTAESIAKLVLRPDRIVTISDESERASSDMNAISLAEIED